MIKLLTSKTNSHQAASLLAGKMNELAVRDLGDVRLADIATKRDRVVVSTLAMCAEQAEECGLGLKQVVLKVLAAIDASTVWRDEQRRVFRHTWSFALGPSHCQEAR